MKLTGYLENSAPFAIKLLWVVIMVVPATWILFVSLKSYGILSAEIAAWFQAVGSVGAIIAAGYFPIAHDKGRERRRVRDALTSLTYLADELYSIQRRLLRALESESGYTMWSLSDKPKELRILSSLVAEMPASMVVGSHMAYLSEIRADCAHAESLARTIADNDFRKLEELEEYKDLVSKQAYKVESIDFLLIILRDERRSF